MTDSHTHLYGEEFSEGGVPAVERALAAGVNRMILPCIDPTSVGPMLALHTRFPENTSIALALHPTEVREDWRERLEEIRRGFGGDRHRPLLGQNLPRATERGLRLSSRAGA